MGWTVGDFNDDGKLDLLGTNSNAGNVENYVSVMMNDGTGAFGPITNYPVGKWPSSAAVGDFNGDGKPRYCRGEQ